MWQGLIFNMSWLRAVVLCTVVLAVPSDGLGKLSSIPTPAATRGSEQCKYSQRQVGVDMCPGGPAGFNASEVADGPGTRSADMCAALCCSSSACAVWVVRPVGIIGVPGCRANSKCSAAFII